MYMKLSDFHYVYQCSHPGCSRLFHSHSPESIVQVATLHREAHAREDSQNYLSPLQQCG